MNKTKPFKFPTLTFDTKYGKVTLYEKDQYFVDSFKGGNYWDENTLIKLKDHIPKDKNILEVGGHCGTSTLFYSKQISDANEYHVFEPQEKMYKLLVHNLKQNNLEKKVKHYNAACFCFDGRVNMNDIDMDGPNSNQEITLLERNNRAINYGGLSIGRNGESVKCHKIDNLKLDDIGFIHSDAQGSENFLFYGAKKLIKKHRPVILYENKDFYGSYLYDLICQNYLGYNEESKFDIRHYCMNELKYNTCIYRFTNFDTLLIP
jgi:FkbM family methyltransferase